MRRERSVSTVDTTIQNTTLAQVGTCLDKDAVYFIINPCDTNYVNRIIEGYEYLGVMTTVLPSKGLVMVRTTSDTYALTKTILSSLDIVKNFLTQEEVIPYLTESSVG